MSRLTIGHAAPAALAAVVALALSGCGTDDSSSDAASAIRTVEIGGVGTEYENTGSGPMVKPTIPDTPSVKTEMGVTRGNTRIFNLTAEQFTQKIANFPMQRAKVWGYNGSSPGPTLVSYEGEKMRVVVTNDLPEPTTIHLHGLHQPNDQDGVAGISQPNPIPAGGSKIYESYPGTSAPSPTTRTFRPRCKTSAGWSA